MKETKRDIMNEGNILSWTDPSVKAIFEWVDTT